MDIRFPILEEIEKNGNCIDFVTLLNKIDATPITTHGVLEVMIQEKLISGTLKANSNVTLKPAGFALLSQLRADADKEARQHTKNKRSKIHANIFQVFLALLTFLLGLIAEHFLEIVHVVLSLFK